MAIFIDVSRGGEKWTNTAVKKAKIKSIIRDSLANDNGHTSQKPIIKIYVHDDIIDVELSASAVGKLRIK